MLRAFWVGSRRVSRMLAGNPDYRRVIAEKTPPELWEILNRRGQWRARLALAAHAHDRLRSVSRITRRPLPECDILASGKTDNNLREFAFIETLMTEAGRSPVLRNLRDVEAGDKAPLDARDRRRQALAARLVWLRVVIAAKADPVLVFQLMQFAGEMTSLLSSLDRGPQPKVALTANDHTPAAVGFASAMRARGVPVVYVQHAEVTERFPPLDFDLSILRNQVSMDAYKAAGPVSGEIEIVSRRPDPPVLEQAEPHDRPLVVVYPTSAYDPDALAKALDRLCDNPAIGSVALKPHPNAARSHVLDDRVHVLTDIPAERHVAVIGNSSIGVELALAGHDVFLLSDLDELADDYYGLARNKIARRINTNGLGATFWKSARSHARLASALAPYEPWLATDQRTVRARVANRLDRLIGQTQASSVSDPGETPTAIAATSARQSDSLAAGREAAFVERFEELLARGDPLAPALLDEIDTINMEGQGVDFWLWLVDAEHRQLTLSEKEARRLRRRVESIRRGKFQDACLIRLGRVARGVALTG